ncbi:MAG: hypothetical protein ABH856_04840 [Patescibacteria group bacterium]|nr:hypothetical protein [Patescibacteria group bacterium]
MSTQQKEFIIDRKAASRLLKVSLRTVDRYIKQKKLSSRGETGRIWLDRAEIHTLKEIRRPKIEVVNVDMSTPKMSIDKSVDIDVDSVDSMSINPTSQMYRREVEEGVYKGLYGDLAEKTRDQEDRLSRATYRLGQLEAQLKYSVPLLEYHKEKRLLRSSNAKLENELTKALDKIKEVKEEYKIEKFNKHIYLIILIGLLFIQPILWLMIR